MKSYWVLWVAHALAYKIIVRQQNHCRSVTYLTAGLSYQHNTAIDCTVGEWSERLRACVRDGGGHFEHTLK